MKIQCYGSLYLSQRRTPATEFVMLMNGYSYDDLNDTIGGGGWVVGQEPSTPKQMADPIERIQVNLGYCRMYSQTCLLNIDTKKQRCDIIL